MSGGTNSSGSRGVARISREQVLCLFRMLEAADLTLQQAQVLIDSGVFSMALRAALNDPEWLRREKTREELYPVVRVNGGVQVRDASELRVGSTGPQHLRLIRLVDDAKLTHNAAEALIDSRVLAIVIDAVQRDPTRLMQEEVKRGLVSPLGLDRHWIDCDVRPVVPIGLKYHDEDQLQSRVRGKFLWYKTKVGLWLSEGQSLGTVEGFAIL